ncbi:hypothetical protein GCM10027174_32270 [Salinifilum aidingensis]
MEPSAQEVSAANEFVRAHGGSARAVVENMGRAGARVVLIGQDGAFGDVVVADAPTGKALVAAVDGLTEHDWDAETTSALRIGPEHRYRMGGVRR